MHYTVYKTLLPCLMNVLNFLYIRARWRCVVSLKI